MLLSITHLLAVFKMQNASAGVNQNCLKAQKPEDMWKCMFAPVSTFTSSRCIIYDPPPLHLSYSTLIHSSRLLCLCLTQCMTQLKLIVCLGCLVCLQTATGLTWKNSTIMDRYNYNSTLQILKINAFAEIPGSGKTSI